MAHKFNVGQTVELAPRLLRSSAPGPYEIRHLVPASDRDPGDRSSSAPDSAVLRTLLQHHQNAPVIAQRLTLAEWLCRAADRIDPARVCGPFRRLGPDRINKLIRDPGWTSSPLRTGLGFRYRQPVRPDVIVISSVRSQDAVTLLLHGFDCGMIRLWATVTIHR